MKINVQIEVDTSTLMDAADNCSTIDEAISQELGWLHDSGMSIVQWNQINEDSPALAE